MRIALIALLGGLLSAVVFPAAAQDATAPDPEMLKDGRKVAGMCRTCHGLDGLARIPIAPHIGGEPVDYLIAQLKAFKSGAREHEMMTVVAGSLSDDQIEVVAHWFNHFDATGTLPANTSEDDAPELCVGCHSANGISTLEDAPNLAGETNIYIETQLKAFRTGKRVHDIMTPIAKDLTDAEMQAAADWYSNIDIKITEPSGN
ncbi:c-type cytochrome [Thalassospira sp.]|uniref:c-type cytochrome n=1 Tax=Thalassospira sp. TaxID=1912094 RepID=UPI000C46E78D|nr:c-type cytochrome [Thalassospira sp.]MBC06078.1 cytochrome C [Thalassospira sp.]|tara:strand:- start:2881 stop:3489 length:609 start_codon:yes stop_codon:yes gene_type:complete